MVNRVGWMHLCGRVSLLLSLVLALLLASGLLPIASLAETGTVQEISLYGVTANTGDAELDLSGQPIKDVDELIAQLNAFPNLRAVNLMDCGLKLKGMKALRAAFPDVDFSWSLAQYGLTVSSGDTSIDLGKQKIKNADLSTFMDFLDCFPSLTGVDMFESRPTEKSVYALLDRYPTIHFGFTLTVCTYPVRTDALVFSMHRSVKPFYPSSSFKQLSLCPDLMAVDLGHNFIGDISFLENCTKLKILILACNRVTDLTSLSKLTDLQYLELFNNAITDISPLASLTNLIDLNICVNDIDDITPLLGLSKLERLFISRAGLTKDQQQTLREALPACEMNFKVYSPTDDGWREHPRFFAMRKILNTGIYEGWDY